MLYEYSSICEYHQKSSLYEYCEFLKKIYGKNIPFWSVVLYGLYFGPVLQL